MLRPIGWPTDDLTLDDIEVMEQVFDGTLAGDWAAGIVAAADAECPPTTGLAFLDDDYHIVGIMLEDGQIVGQQTGNVVDGLARPDTCFAMRAFWQGFDRVRPMPLAPVAIFNTLSGTSPDGSRLGWGPNEPLTAAATADVPEGAKVFVEVDPAQPDVVYDVWAVAPSTSPGGIGIWRRHDGQWMDDPGWISALRSDSPPNLIYLPSDSPILVDLLTQVDAATAGKQFTAMTASIVVAPEVYTDLLPLIARGTRGGLKRAAGVGKGGNAEVLRQYWGYGKGAAKIRWGVGGDWYRCVSQLRKYLGTRAKGYCAKMHIDVLGYNTSTHKKMTKGSKG